MLTRHLLPLLAGGALLLAACDGRRSAEAGSPPPVTYQGRGVLQELKSDGHKAVIAHETIPGFMDAMTMEFKVEDAGLTKGLVRGDEVEFRLTVTEYQGGIDQLRKTGHRELPPLEVIEPKLGEVGAAVPETALLDQAGHPLHLTDFRGQVLIFTFIYTRCPFPDFCPRMTDQFATTQRLLKEAGAGEGWHFASISIDPEFDTPERLAAYAQRHSADPARWTFATGDPQELQKLAETFGIVVVKDGAQWNHNLRTVVVGRDGRVRTILPGNEWKPAELVAEVQHALAVRR
jgi:protein SCO1/2